MSYQVMIVEDDPMVAAIDRRPHRDRPQHHSAAAPANSLPHSKINRLRARPAPPAACVARRPSTGKTPAARV